MSVAFCKGMIQAVLGRNSCFGKHWTHTRFVIICPARSGSTMLVHSLNSHPEITCHGESFGDTASLVGVCKGSPAERCLARVRDADCVRYLEEFVLGMCGTKVVGFKFKYDELVWAKHRRVVDKLTKDRSILVIQLDRANLLKRCVSYYAVNKVTHICNTTKVEEVPKGVRLRIEPSQMAADFALIEQREKLFSSRFERHRRLRITYESLVEQYDQTMESIQEFLGVEIRHLPARTLKMLPDQVQDVLENYEEVRDYFRNTRYAKFFES